MKTKIVLLSVTLLLIATQDGVFATTPTRSLAFGANTLDGSTQTQELAITLIPHNAPVTLPSSGGNFDFTVGIDNVGLASADFETWTVLEYPDGAMVGPFQGPFDFLLPSAWSASNDLSQGLADDAPAGTYVFHVYAGQYPGVIQATDTFSVEKEGSTPAWYSQSAGTNHSMFAVYFTDRDNGWISGMLNTILHTTDGGDNWYPQPIPPSSHYYDLHFVDALRGWTVGTSGKIAHTTDGGESWAFQPSGTNYNFYGVHFIDGSTGWAVGGIEASFSPARRLIKRTTDGGNSWVTQFAESYKNPFKDVHFVDANHGWAVGGESLEGTIFRTSDGGASWYEQDAAEARFIYGAFFTDASEGWAVGYDGTIVHTQTGGD